MLTLCVNEEIIQTNDVLASVEQSFAPMRAEKAGTAGEEDARAVGGVLHLKPLWNYSRNQFPWKLMNHQVSL